MKHERTGSFPTLVHYGPLIPLPGSIDLVSLIFPNINPSGGDYPEFMASFLEGAQRDIRMLSAVFNPEVFGKSRVLEVIGRKFKDEGASVKILISHESFQNEAEERTFLLQEFPDLAEMQQLPDFDLRWTPRKARLQYAVIDSQDTLHTPPDISIETGSVAKIRRGDQKWGQEWADRFDAIFDSMPQVF